MVLVGVPNLGSSSVVGSKRLVKSDKCQTSSTQLASVVSDHEESRYVHMYVVVCIFCMVMQVHHLH